ncbi:MAG: hypothetical protein GQ557_02580, partial [Mycoplasmataceae bacterium]|nr:hypothetical protein [Mycoplasmataceae bacterium]
SSSLEQNAINFSRYTDEVGELTRLEMLVYEDLATITSTASQKLFGKLLPNVLTTPVNKLFDAELYVLKDRRSILKGMLQEQIVSTDNRVLIIGNQLAKRNRLITDNSPTDYYVYIYDTVKFGILDNKVPLDGSTYGGQLVNSSHITLDTTNKKITFSSTQLTSSLSSWCITDENRNLLFAVNQDGILLDTLTFDFNNKRSETNYNY